MAQEHGMGVLVWSPLAGGMLTGRYRRGQANDTHRSRFGFDHMTDERRLDAVEALLPIAEDAGISLLALALAFVVAHPGVTSAIVGPRTMEHLEGTLAVAGVGLDDATLDRIDAVVAPGTDVTPMQHAYRTPPMDAARLRRRPADERAAAEG